MKEGDFLDYLILFKSITDIPDEVYLLAYIYAKKSLQSESNIDMINSCSIKCFYGVCVLIAYKYLVETDTWLLRDYCQILSISERALYLFEWVIVDQFLDYKLYVSDKEFFSEKQNIDNRLTNIKRLL
jgi:hypothetical protein